MNSLPDVDRHKHANIQQAPLGCCWDLQDGCSLGFERLMTKDIMMIMPFVACVHTIHKCG